MRKKNKFIPYIVSTPAQHHKEQQLKHNVSHQQEYFNVNTGGEPIQQSSVNYFQKTYESPFSSTDDYRIQDKPDNDNFRAPASFPIRPASTSFNDTTIDEVVSVEEITPPEEIDMILHPFDDIRNLGEALNHIQEIEDAIVHVIHSDPDDDEDFIMYPDNTEYDANDFNNQMNHEFGNHFSSVDDLDMDVPTSAEELNNQMMLMEENYGLFGDDRLNDMTHESSRLVPQEYYPEPLFDDPFDLYVPMF